MLISRWETLEDFSCPACRRAIPTYVDEKAKQALEIEHCLVCDSKQLFTQKSFNRNLGLGIVAAGIVLSFWTYGISLIVVALVDLFLYKLLPPMLVCYRCDGEFRGFKPNPRFKPYNHLKAAHVKKQPTYPGAEEAEGH
ncbi:MAG TPA: hypothetical protein DF383_05885 [Deltaproteobacteria bacterium]|nr:hypothetical protein [Deltaproteobacteria bacterium]